MQRVLFVAGLVLLVGCGTPMTVSLVGQHVAEQARQQATDEDYAAQMRARVLLPTEPVDGVGMFVELVQAGGADAAENLCAIFDGQAQAEFAAAQREPDCVSAVERLSTRVTDPAVYVNDLHLPRRSWTITGPFAVINGCAVRWNPAFSGLFSNSTVPPPGPRPGRWMMRQVFGDRWEIINYQPC